MNFEKGQLYHIYNQGNNSQKIFFERKNYLFFLRKIRTYILPYADFFAWCLLPNHFHLMVLVNEVEVNVGGSDSEGFASSETLALSSAKRIRTLNQSIGVLLRSYTSAINKQQKRTGSLFRKQTKAECISCINGVTPSFYSTKGIARIKISNPELQYPQICFDYIHQNPVKAGLVKKAIDWEFSSAQDFYGKREGSMVNKQRAIQYIDY